MIVSGLAFHHESHSPTRITNENSGNRAQSQSASSVSEVHRWLLIEAPESGSNDAQAACVRSGKGCANVVRLCGDDFDRQSRPHQCGLQYLPRTARDRVRLSAGKSA